MLLSLATPDDRILSQSGTRVQDRRSDQIEEFFSLTVSSRTVIVLQWLGGATKHVRRYMWCTRVYNRRRCCYCWLCNHTCPRRSMKLHMRDSHMSPPSFNLTAVNKSLRRHRLSLGELLHHYRHKRCTCSRTSKEDRPLCNLCRSLIRGSCLISSVYNLVRLLCHELRRMDPSP